MWVVVIGLSTVGMSWPRITKSDILVYRWLHSDSTDTHVLNDRFIEHLKQRSGRLHDAVHLGLLLKMKCLPVLFYGRESCPLNKSETRSPDFAIGIAFSTIFCTKSQLIDNCRTLLNCGWQPVVRGRTSSSAAAERPREPLSQLKSCQLLHNCTKNHIWLEGLPFHVI